MNTFETLHDLSIELLTARPGSALGRLTVHHGHGTEEAEAIVRAAVLTREMPSESPTTRWCILRVFMRNLVNRSQAPGIEAGGLDPRRGCPCTNGWAADIRPLGGTSDCNTFY
ncbi:MAG: hypothetical protein QUV35_13000 [Hydrogenophaga sp.]|uniref:hypothetical protein n=1 Tax=Hydrogenophaga sp. TaxID=1904254 RepID=UPI002614D57A|nr:hypothetical protein [Hydrogenophaga sp.]MDM7943535.1 hypothetical protein [Hydrogenophaga sp.]